MKSTGEVMGSDYYLEKALYKAFEASGFAKLWGCTFHHC